MSILPIEIDSRAAFLLRITLIAAAVAICDQLIKILIRATLDTGSVYKLVPGLSLVNIRNTGVAFGLFSGSAGALIILTLVVLVLLALYLLRQPDLARFSLPVGLLLGGALGNLIDRVWRAAVTDYIDPLLWPAFNLADVAIVLGVVGLLLEALAASSDKSGTKGSDG